MNRRYRRCQCMHNTNNFSQDEIEQKCSNVSSYGQNEPNECDCGFDEEYDVLPTNPMLAQSYVPLQFMNKTFKPEIALGQGTIFPELVSPYSPGQSMEEIAFIERTNKIGEGCNR